MPWSIIIPGFQKTIFYSLLDETNQSNVQYRTLRKITSGLLGGEYYYLITLIQKAESGKITDMLSKRKNQEKEKTDISYRLHIDNEIEKVWSELGRYYRMNKVKGTLSVMIFDESGQAEWKVMAGGLIPTDLE